MSETDLTAAQADALSGTTDSDADLTYPTIGESTYYTTAYRAQHRTLLLAKSPGGNELRVGRDGDLTVEVRPGYVQLGTTVYDHSGVTGESVTNNQTNYVYLTTADLAAGNSVTVNTTGFPTDGSLLIPLATVATGTASTGGVSGTYDYRDIADFRGRGQWVLAGGLKISAEAEGDYAANERRITIQGGPWRQLVRVWVDDADFGAPDATGNTITVETGTI
ncbi:hypothetical protein LCGC14_2863370, partial [marine sediment metagenome]